MDPVTTINQTTTHTTYWVARGALGQLIAVAPGHRLVVAVGSVATTTWTTDPDEVSFLLTDVIVPARMMTASSSNRKWLH